MQLFSRNECFTFLTILMSVTPSIRRHLSKDVQRNTFKSQCTDWIQAEPRNGAGYLLPRVQTSSGVHTCFLSSAQDGLFLAEVNVTENSVLTSIDVARFPSARGEKLQWPPLREIMNIKKNHGSFCFFALPFILLDNSLSVQI